jgi:hypothetical protein
MSGNFEILSAMKIPPMETDIQMKLWAAQGMKFEENPQNGRRHTIKKALSCQSKLPFIINRSQLKLLHL